MVTFEMIPRRRSDLSNPTTARSVALELGFGCGWCRCACPATGSHRLVGYWDPGTMNNVTGRPSGLFRSRSTLAGEKSGFAVDGIFIVNCCKRRGYLCGSGCMVLVKVAVVMSVKLHRAGSPVRRNVCPGTRLSADIRSFWRRPPSSWSPS